MFSLNRGAAAAIASWSSSRDRFGVEASLSSERLESPESRRLAALPEDPEDDVTEARPLASSSRNAQSSSISGRDDFGLQSWGSDFRGTMWSRDEIEF